MSFLKKGRYIAVEGVIGVGKTTLTKLIAERYNGKFFLEVVEENPFLEPFYADKEKYAFQAQIFFLLSRFKQQQELMQMDLFSNFIVSDYFFEKDRIFAYLNLNEKELGLYETLWKMMSRTVSKPDLVIYLSANTDIIMSRIEKRGRSFEHNMDRHYIENLKQAYDYFFFHYNDSNSLTINTDKLDYVNDPEHLELILKQIEDFTSGKKYIDPFKKI